MCILVNACLCDILRKLKEQGKQLERYMCHHVCEWST